ncbi:hypothetical protein BHE74_00011207 [Ensete ventricosum]|nr:hypothetical protein BHE74_00011207 [Ensete ventricosum]
MSATRSGSKKEMEWLRRFHLARESGRPLQPILESLPSRAKNRKRCGIALPEECVCVFGGTAQRVLPPLRLPEMAVVRPEVGVWRERNKTGKTRRSARCHVCGVGTPEGSRKGRTVGPSKGRKKQREFLGGGYLFEGRPVTKSEAHKGGHRTKEAWSGKRRKGKGEEFRSAGGKGKGRGGRKRR